MKPAVNSSPRELIEMLKEGKILEVWELIADQSNGLLALLNVESPTWFSEAIEKDLPAWISLKSPHPTRPLFSRPSRLPVWPNFGEGEDPSPPLGQRPHAPLRTSERGKTNAVSLGVRAPNFGGTPLREG
jgi:hypothetical protein